MLNTFPKTCRAQTEESHCWYSALFMLVPFSCFHLVKENVYPAALLLIRGHCPRGAGEADTEVERLLCSIKGIHRVLSSDIVSTSYCFSRNWMFSYSRHLPPTGHSQRRLFFFRDAFKKTFFLLIRKTILTNSAWIQKWTKYQLYRNWPHHYILTFYSSLL